MESLPVESRSVGFILLDNWLAFLLVFFHELIEALVTSIGSDLQLIGIKNFIQWFEIRDDREVLVVLDFALRADIGSISDVGVGAAIVLAVNTESIEFVFLDSCLNVDLLLVRLWCDW